MKYLSSLADTFTVVCWDQRGAGKNYSFRTSNKEKMTLDSCVEDTHTVIGLLKKKFFQDKIFIVGHSWGSVLGVLTISRYPEDIAAYVGIGQFVNGSENERLSYEFTMSEAKRRNDKKAVRTLEKIGAPQNGTYNNANDFLLQRNYLQKYGGAVFDTEESITRFVIKAIFTTNEYSPLDYVRYFLGRKHCIKLLYGEMILCDFLKDILTLSVPVYITQGKHDFNTPSVLAKQWFDALEAPEKAFIWFENSAHSPHFEESALWAQTIRRVLIK